jgi:hypothetical protein
MRTVVLSDHPDDMLAVATSERQRGVTEQETILNATRRSRDEARTRGQWLTWLRLTFRARREMRKLARLRVFSQFPTGREDAIRAGRDAERRVAAELGCALDDGWVLLRGYKNRRGEIDGLLLGPSGVFAYEVKYHNGTVYISGDEWQSEKFDKYGNLVSGRAPMRDRRGRSPSLQLSEPAGALEDWLRKRGQPVAVTPVVLLTHERARVGASENPTVAVTTSVQGLLRLAERSTAKLGVGRRAMIERIIRDDHRHHEQRAYSPRPA